MTTFLPLLPLMILTGAILVLMMAIAFMRNLALSCGISVIGLILTLISIIWVNLNLEPSYVTPLLRVDDFGLLFSGIMAITALFICLLAYSYHQNRGEHQDEFFLLLLLATLGAMVLTISVHFASFVLGLELLGISIYALISYPTKGVFSLEAALKYLILSGVSSAFILFGAGLLYAVSGTLSFADFASGGLPNTATGQVFVLAGSAMMLAGIGFKLSLVPFHMWTPDVYEGAPAPVAGFLATISKGSVFAALMRFFLAVDGYQYDSIMTGLYWIAGLSMLFGNILALLQSSIKRLLAYSSIAQFGYLMVAFIAISELAGRHLAIEAAVFFLIAYFITTIGAFGVVTIMSDKSEDHDLDSLDAYEGLFWQRPLLAAFMSIMLLSLAGIPLTAGFIGKFYILASGVESQLWPLLVIVVIGSGIGLFYYLRVIYAMTKKAAANTDIKVSAAGGWTMAVVTLVLLVLGVYPAPVIEWVSNMALQLV
ncbi:MAG: NADH-quinone oxidoreductase subunit N [Pseudomonadales bacterium]|jgi:NADH-quinone oxidoreductase subunit N|nr:NADH-quinone oxidoreductase subunit N [Pseudomonadales bacterium]